MICLQFRFPNVSGLPFDCQSKSSRMSCLSANNVQLLFNKKTTTVLMLPFFLHLQRMIYLFITLPHDPVNESLTKLWLWELVIHLWDFSSNLSLTNACEVVTVYSVSNYLLISRVMDVVTLHSLAATTSRLLYSAAAALHSLVTTTCCKSCREVFDGSHTTVQLY